MIGFKAFNKDLTCRGGMQYEIGNTYEFDGEPIACEQGFHFCKSIAECYSYYEMSENTRICVIEALGDIVTDDDIKYCTNKISILYEITDEWIRKGNVNTSSSGYCNTGYYNTGSFNTGNDNTGSFNTGNDNTGSFNTGNRNTGYYNTGNRNTGYYNTGSFNTGNRNTGYYNTGSFNTGYCNTGDRNTGDFNTGNWNTGCFNKMEVENLQFFNKPSNWTYDQWFYSDARQILSRRKMNVLEWVTETDMTDEEKEQNPSYITTGGYLKVLDNSDSAQLWWDSLNNDEKNIIRDLPNFDEKIFSEIMGINI